MNLKRFECFVAVAEELHFGRAAARLNMTQPPLSQQIQALEDEYGVRLFERPGKPVRLTVSGEALLPMARELLACAIRAEDAARLAHLGEAGMLRVGYVNPAMDAVLSQAIRAFREERPGVSITLVEMASSAQAEALREGTLHAGFMRHGWLDMSGLTVRVVHRDRYVLAAPDGHPLAQAGSVPLERLDGADLILHPRSSQPRLHDAMTAALERAGVRARVAQEAVSKHTTLSLVAAGMGVALVPASSRVWGRSGVCFTEVEGVLPEVEIAGALPRNACVAAQALVGLTANLGNAGGA